LTHRGQIEMEKAFENLVVGATNQKIQDEERKRANKLHGQQSHFKETWEHQMKVSQDKKIKVE